jgi:hypothetical protein
MVATETTVLCAAVTCSVSSWLAYVAAALVCAQVLGVNVGPLLAVGGASGIIVGLVSVLQQGKHACLLHIHCSLCTCFAGVLGSHFAPRTWQLASSTGTPCGRA